MALLYCMRGHHPAIFCSLHLEIAHNWVRYIPNGHWNYGNECENLHQSRNLFSLQQIDTVYSVEKKHDLCITETEFSSVFSLWDTRAVIHILGWLLYDFLSHSIHGADSNMIPTTVRMSNRYGLHFILFVMNDDGKAVSVPSLISAECWGEAWQFIR